MSRKLSALAVAAVLVIPAPLMAGGPPRLYLPIDGVTAENAEQCAKRLTEALGRKVNIQRHDNQPYAMFFLGGNVGLSDVEEALNSSGISVPRDKLRLFGHVNLKVNVGSTNVAEILADLAAMKNVSVGKSRRDADVLLVTVDMPYGSPLQDTFRWCDFSSVRRTAAERPAMPRRALPSHDDFRDVFARHNASLTDLRWTGNWGCRPLGCVVATKR